MDPEWIRDGSRGSRSAPTEPGNQTAIDRGAVAEMMFATLRAIVGVCDRSAVGIWLVDQIRRCAARPPATICDRSAVRHGVDDGGAKKSDGGRFWGQ